MSKKMTIVTIVFGIVFGIVVGTIIVLGMVVPGEIIIGTFTVAFGIICYVSGITTMLGVSLFIKRGNSDTAKTPAPQPSILVMGGHPQYAAPPSPNSYSSLPERSEPRQFNVIGDDD